MNDRVLPAAPFTTPMPKVKPPKASHTDLVEAAIRYAREGGAGFDTDVERNIAELGARRAISMFTREEGFYDHSFASSAPDTITLSRDELTSALREATAQGMDRTSGQWSGYAASCREIAARIAKDIEAGRFSSDNYHYLDSDRRAS